MIKNSRKPILIWLFSGCFLVFAMVIVGGITRLTHSGLSITEWNVIMGSFPPLTDADWNTVFLKYQQFPEFRIVNYNMTLSEFKGIFWWEFIHRLIGRLIGIVFLIPFLYFNFKGMIPRKLNIKLIGVFVLGAFQGFLGWYMVASGLVQNPHVSHYRLAAHLITAFITFGYIFWLAMDLIFPRRQRHFVSPLKKYGLTLLALVMVQIIYGAFVAGLRAGLIYNTFPKMGSEWFPDAITAMKPSWKNLTENMAGVQFVHRCIAMLVLGLVFAIWYKSKKLRLIPMQKNSLSILLVVTATQIVLGVSTLLLAVPVWLGVLHQITAFALFASCLFFVHETR